MQCDHSPKALVIGDIHGCADELEELLGQVPDLHSRQVISVGDIIHKGPKSRKALELLEQHHAWSVLGNHELKFLKYVEHGFSGHPTMDPLKEQLGDRLDYWCSYLKNLPSYIETPDWLIVHAGLVPHLHPRDTSLQLITNIRTWDGLGDVLESDHDPAWFECRSDKKLVIFGHWARRGLVVRPHEIGLDSGCVYGKQLSAVMLPERTLIHVDAHHTYVAIT